MKELSVLLLYWFLYNKDKAFYVKWILWNSGMNTPVVMCVLDTDLFSQLHFEGSRPEWCISSMRYSRDTPFWSETLFCWSVAYYCLGWILSCCTGATSTAKCKEHASDVCCANWGWPPKDTGCSWAGVSASPCNHPWQNCGNWGSWHEGNHDGSDQAVVHWMQVLQTKSSVNGMWGWSGYGLVGVLIPYIQCSRIHWIELNWAGKATHH